jgi:large repetitive protein
VPTAASRRVLASVVALALGVAGTLVAAPALAAPSTDPTPLTPVAGTVTNDSTPTFTWTAGASDFPNTLRYRVEVLDSLGNTERFIPALFDEDWTVLVPLADGDYSWRVRGIDRIASSGPWSTTVPFTVDTVAPDVTLTAPSSGTFGAGGVTVAGTVSDLHPATVVLRDNGVVVATDSTGGSSFAFTYAPTSGTHTLEVVATDAAGNSDAGSTASVVVSIDADAPSLAILSPTHDSWVKVGAPLTFHATAADANRFSWNGRLDGVGIPGAYGHLVTGPVDYQTSIDTSAWAHGSSHVLLFTGNDEFSQKSTLTATVKADASRPVVTFATPAVSSQLSGIVTISGAATDTGSGIDSFLLHVRKLNSATGNCGAFIGGGFTVTVASDGTWTLPFDSTGYVDGEYCFTALASDRVGNNNAGGNHLKSVSFDNTAPAGALSALFPQGFVLTGDRYEWTPLSDPNNVHYEVAVGSHPNVDAEGRMTNLTATFGPLDATTVPSNLVTGPAFWQVRAVDDLGNHTAWTAPTGYQVVGVPSIVYPTPGLQFSADTLTAQWTPSFGVVGVERYEIEYGLDRDHDGTLAYEYRTAPGHTTWPVALQTRAQSFTTGYEGPLTIRVRAVYGHSFNGSVNGPWSAPAVAYLRDTAKPTITIVTPSAGTVVKSDAALPVTITGTDAAGISRLAANLYAADGTTFLGPIGSTPPNGALGQSATRTWSIPAGLAEGTYTIRASATDAAGKTTATSQAFTVDRTRPTVTIDLPADGTVTNGDVTVTVTGLDPNGIRSIAANLYNEANANPLLRSIGQSTAPANSTTHSATWTIPISWFTADGTYTIRAGGVDAAGNNRTVTAQFTIDSTGPAAPQPYNPENGRTQANDSPVLDWVPVSDAVSYEVRTSASPARVPNVNDGELSGTDAVTVSASNSEFQLSGLPQGWLWWQVRGIDALGNVGPWSNIWALGVDTVGPAVSLLTPVDGAVLTTGSFTLDWTDGETGATYEVRSSNDPSVDADGALDVSALTGTATASELALVGVPEATYYWQVRALDTLGNAGPWTTPWMVSVDLPTLSVPGTEGPAGGTGGTGGAGTGDGGVDLTTFALDDETPEGDEGEEGDGESTQSDDDSTPTAADPTSAQTGMDGGMIALLVGLAAALLLLLVVLLAWLRRRRAEA